MACFLFLLIFPSFPFLFVSCCFWQLNKFTLTLHRTRSGIGIGTSTGRITCWQVCVCVNIVLYFTLLFFYLILFLFLFCCCFVCFLLFPFAFAFFRHCSWRFTCKTRVTFAFPPCHASLVMCLTHTCVSRLPSKHFMQFLISFDFFSSPQSDLNSHKCTWVVIQNNAFVGQKWQPSRDSS